MLGLLGATQRRWRWGPLRYWDSLGLPQNAGAEALCDIGTPWDCPKALALEPCAILGLRATAPKRCRSGPVRFWDSLGLPQNAGAGGACDVGISWDCRKVLALGPCATLGLVGTRWDSLGLARCSFQLCFSRLFCTFGTSGSWGLYNT